MYILYVLYKIFFNSISIAIDTLPDRSIFYFLENLLKRQKFNTIKLN